MKNVTGHEVRKASEVHTEHAEKVSLLTGEMAQRMVNAAFLEAQKDQLMVSITVVDRSGQTLAVLRDHREACILFVPAIKKPIPPIRRREKPLKLLKVLKMELFLKM